MNKTTTLPPLLNRVYHVRLELTFDYGRQTKYFTTVVAALDAKHALEKTKQRLTPKLNGEITDTLVVEQKGARW